MKTTLKFITFLMLATCLCMAAFAAESTVYYDGVGTAANSYADLTAAIEAVADGGTVVLTANFTSTATVELPAKNVTITSQNNAVINLKHALKLGGNTTFTNIKIDNARTATNYLYCLGNDLTVCEDVTLTNSGGKTMAIFAGNNKKTACDLNNTITVHSGAWGNVYLGGYFTTDVCSGNVTFNLYGENTSIGTLKFGNLNNLDMDVNATVNIYGGSVSDITQTSSATKYKYTVNLFGGTATKISVPVNVDLTNGGTVTISNENGQTVTTTAPDGYEVVKSGSTYSVQKVEVVAPTTVYVDGTGATAGAYTSFEDAFTALSSEGGTVIVCGDTQLGTTDKGVNLGNYNDFTGKVTITSENGAKLIFARSMTLNTDIEFKNIHIHCIIPSNLTANNNILARGNKFIVCEDVTMTKEEDAIYPTVVGGYTSATTYDSYIVIKSGAWQNIYGGGFSNTFAGDSYVEVSNTTVVGTISTGNRAGTFSGNGTLVIDLRGDKTVSATSFSENPTILVDEGYEAVLANGTYLQREPIVADVIYVDGTGNTEGAYTSLAEAIVAYTGGEIIVCGDTTVSGELFVPEKENDITITSQNGAILTLNADISFAKNTNGKSVTFDIPVKANGAKIFGGFRNVTFTENFTVDGSLSFFGGVDVSALENNADAITEKEYAVTVNGGTFENFALGNYRYEYKHMVGSIAAPVTLTVNGGTFNSLFNVSGMAIIADDVTLNITGGTFNCPIYVRGGMGTVNTNGVIASQTVNSNSKYYAIDGDIAVNISGGTFNGGLIGAYEEQTAYTQVMRGDYAVTVSGGTFADGTVFDATQVKAYANSDKKATITYPDTYNFSVVRFDNVNGATVTYDEPIRIAYIGDSITEGYVSKDRLTDSYPAVLDSIAAEKGAVDLVSSNFGISASGILPSTSYYFPDYLGYTLIREETDADYIVIAIGTNDSAAGGTTGALNTFEKEYRTLVETVGKVPTTKKVFVTNAIIRNNENTAQARVASVVRPLQEKIAREFAAQDAEKYVFIDLFRLTLPYAAEGKLLSTDNLHPNTAGYKTMAEVLYGVIFEGKPATTNAYYSNDVYVKADGKPFASGTIDDPISRLDLAFAMLPAGEESTIHIIGKVAFAGSIYTPIAPSKVTIVGEESGAILENGDASFKIGSDIKFDNIILSTIDSTEIYGCYNDIEMTDTVMLTGDWSFFAGHNVYNEGVNNAAHDTVASASDDKDCNIVLNASGTFNNFAFGNRRRQGKAPFGTYSGNLTAYIGGNITISGTDYVGIVGQNYLTGSITVEMPETLTLAEYAPTYTVTSPIVYDSTKNTGNVTVKTYVYTPEVIPTTVYVDGTGETDGAYATLEEAAFALRNGGTIVVCGDVNVNASTTLAAGGELLITSLYEGEDYTDVAAIKVAADIVLATPTTFKNVTLDKASYSTCYIVANGNALVIDEGVYCRNTLATSYITIVGGALSGTFEGNSNITVKSGFFRNIFGGNHKGTFIGDSKITFVGGMVNNIITGGSYAGNFEGDAYINIGGEAVFVASDSKGVIGACYGNSSTAYTFDGNIYMDFYGNARVNTSVYGAGYSSGVTTTGNVEIKVRENAFVYSNLYAGGYLGVLNGDTRTVIDGGEVGVSVGGGNRGGTVNGDTYVEINSGRFNYYNTNMHSSMSPAAGAYGIGGGGRTGTVNGNTEVVIRGGDFNGNVFGGALEDGGTVTGSSKLTVCGGDIIGGISADSYTAGGTKGTKTLIIDLSSGKTLQIGLPAEATEIIGGGKLLLAPKARITAEKISGNIALEIDGIPLAGAYITATTVAEGTNVSYTEYDREKFVIGTENGKTTYGISSEGYYETTTVVVKHNISASIRMRTGSDSSTALITPTKTTATETTYVLTPGLYNYVIYYAEDDYLRKSLYITGREETRIADFSGHSKRTYEGFEANKYAQHPDEVLEEYYGTDGLLGYETPDTPYFTNHLGTRVFSSNAEVSAYVYAKAKNCDYMYVFDAFTSPNGYTMPVAVFTKDEIPAGATIEDVAKIVTKEKGRDIILIEGGVHGNEPSGSEGTLAMIGEMAGEYGNTYLSGNIGAVIIIPRLNPDGYYTFTRNTPVGDQNLNRDYAMLSSPEIAGAIRIYNLFEPTVFVDCHEAPAEPKYGSADTLTDVYDIGMMSSATLNTSLNDSVNNIKGDISWDDYKGFDIVTSAIEKIAQAGLRPYYYNTAGGVPTTATNYGAVNGAYTFIFEVPGITGGESFFARRVFAQMTGIKSLMAVVKESNGALAADVVAGRERLTLDAQKFDVDNPVVLDYETSHNAENTLRWNNPIVAADATLRDEDNLNSYYVPDVVVKYRSMATAYVISADVDVSAVLSVLDKQNIKYYKLDKGVTLDLKQYSGTVDTAKLGEKKSVTFENGAYIIPLDGYKAYMTSVLFEPENADVGDDVYVTFAQAGYLKVEDIYRSEESFIAAKLGLDGTYKAFDVAEGKTVSLATVDGKVYGDVNVEGCKAYLAKPDSETYTVVINYTDGTSDTYKVCTLEADVNGDGEITVSDAVALIDVALNKSGECDLNGDGKTNLIDILYLIKTLAQ